MRAGEARIVAANKSAMVPSSQASSVNKMCGSTFIMNFITKTMFEVYLASATPRWALQRGAWLAPQGASIVMATGMLLVVCPRRARVDHNMPGETTG